MLGLAAHLAELRFDRSNEFDEGLFIIRNGQKVTSYEVGEWVALLPGVVGRVTPNGFKIEMSLH